MKTKRRVEIEVETARLTIRRKAGAVCSLPCLSCGAMVDMLTAETAALWCGCTLRWLVNHLETSALHYAETADGQLRICLNSLLQTNPTGAADASGEGQDINQLLISIKENLK